MMNFLKGGVTPSLRPEQPKEMDYLVPGETLEARCRLYVDSAIFTDKRIIFLDNKVISNKRKIVSVPYGKITAIEIEKGGLQIGQEITLVVGSKEYEMRALDAEVAKYIYEKLLTKIL